VKEKKKEKMMKIIRSLDKSNWK